MMMNVAILLYDVTPRFLYL